MNSKYIFIVPLALVVISAVQAMPGKVPTSLINMCCSIGNQTAKSGKCSEMPTINRVAPAAKTICQRAWLSCCMLESKRISCTKGVTKAMQLTKCAKPVADGCGEVESACCNQCKFGFELAVAGNPCEIAVTNSALDEVSKSCCKQMTKQSALKQRYQKARVSDIKSLSCANLKCSHTCMETTAGPACVCPTGFTIGKDGRNCADIDECRDNPNICSLFNTCFNTDGSYYCSRKQRCGPGYELKEGNCVDINECSKQPEICGEGRCLNQAGTYYCRCYPGYLFNATLKKCQESNPCDLNLCEHQCENLGRGRYRCRCPEGKILNNDRKTCREYDPCENNRCKHGCKAVDKTRYRCICPEGYRVDVDGLSCIMNSYRVNIEIKNVDPMVSYNLKWNEGGNKRSINIPTSTTVSRNLVYESARQPETLAFKLYDMKGRLISINGKQEFMVKPVVGNIDVKLQVGTNDPNPCRAFPCHQNCENMGGGRYRCTCRSGYTMNREGKCEVVRDPCRNKPCQYQCYNMGSGQFRCTCPFGQELDKDGRTCKARNPCQFNRCQWKCKHDGRNAQCICPNGYRLEGDRCIDIDECRSSSSLCYGSQTKCFNTYGSYKCAPNACPKSYYVKGGGSYCYKRCSTGSTECQNDKVYAYQWLYSKVLSGVPPDGLSYYYSVYKPSFNHRITYRIDSGNENGDFYLVKDNEYRVTIKNRKKIVGPKDYKLKLLVSIYKNGRLNSQMVSTFHVYVSPYTFY